MRRTGLGLECSTPKCLVIKVIQDCSIWNLCLGIDRLLFFTLIHSRPRPESSTRICLQLAYTSLYLRLMAARFVIDAGTPLQTSDQQRKD